MLRTIEVRGANKGDVDAEVAVVRGAVEAEVDTKGNGGPGRVLLAAVEADLSKQDKDKSAKESISISTSTLPDIRYADSGTITEAFLSLSITSSHFFLSSFVQITRLSYLHSEPELQYFVLVFSFSLHIERG